MTLQVVEDHLTDDQIFEVLTAPNYSIANKIILNYLMERVKCTADVLELCDQLEIIASLLPHPHGLTQHITELRTGLV